MAASPSLGSSSTTNSRLSSHGYSADLDPPSPSAEPDVDEDDEDDENDSDGDDDAPLSASSVPVETLVSHLLAAKRALSSVALVLRANDIATSARQLHEESVILSAQTAFLRRGISEQVRVLLRIRRGMGRVHDTSKREFKSLIKTLDGANTQLEGTMEMLRGTVVESGFRPAGEEPRSLLDFVDDEGVEKLREAVKACLADMQAAQASFDTDLFQFDADLRTLNKIMSSAPADPSPSSSNAYQPIPYLLASLASHSHSMAEHLASLTRHFDMCVTAVRTTEGGAALARRRAAEASQTGDDGANDAVSISGVIADVADLEEPLSAAERTEVVQVVLQDAPEVDEVVAELNAVLHAMDGDFALLREQADGIRAAHGAAVAAFRALQEAGARLPAHAAAEAEFAERWEAERAAVLARLDEMGELRVFYEGYASAYDSLILEVERRRGVEDKVRAIWRRAGEAADRLADADRREREMFMQEIGEFLPTDLWPGMGAPMTRWEARPVAGESDGKESGLSGERGMRSGSAQDGVDSTPALERGVVDAARDRLARAGDDR